MGIFKFLSNKKESVKQEWDAPPMPPPPADKDISSKEDLGDGGSGEAGLPEFPDFGKVQENIRQDTGKDDLPPPPPSADGDSVEEESISPDDHNQDVPLTDDVIEEEIPTSVAEEDIHGTHMSDEDDPSDAGMDNVAGHEVDMIPQVSVDTPEVHTELHSEIPGVAEKPAPPSRPSRVGAKAGSDEVADAFYVKVDPFKNKVIRNINNIKLELKSSEELISRIGRLEDTETRLFSELHTKMEDVQEKLLHVDNVMFVGDTHG